MDFDDLLFKPIFSCATILIVLLKYQNMFRYILVDEYQDTNLSQYMILRQLAARHQNIAVVGDDAQSIYAFRGAIFRTFSTSKSIIPIHRYFKLEQNYVPHKTLVHAANS